MSDTYKETMIGAVRDVVDEAVVGPVRVETLNLLRSMLCDS